jgi:hypothetical protein
MLISTDTFTGTKGTNLQQTPLGEGWTAAVGKTTVHRCGDVPINPGWARSRFPWPTE